MEFYHTIDDDVIIKEEMSYQQKIIDISTYAESESIKIVKPTTDICNYFKDSILYAPASLTGYQLCNNRLFSSVISPNKYDYSCKEDLIKHLENRSKIYYLVKIIQKPFGNSEVWTMYVYEKNNLSTIRDEKINSILNENNTM
jgi:hypothetical protein